MKKLILALLFLSGTLFSQVEIKSPVIPNKVNGDLVVLAGTVDFKFSNIGTWWIPKFKPFWTSTTFTDSTNYVTLNKGLYVFDSIKTDRDLIVKGAVVLDTLRQGKVYFTSTGLEILNSKTSGQMLFTADGLMTFTNRDGYRLETQGGAFVYTDATSNQTLTVNSTGLQIEVGDITLDGGTQQIKLPSDTASNYTGSDTITINRQSGTVTTKSITTATDNFYTFYLKNSLISATSKVFLVWSGGTESAGRPMVYRVTPASGLATVIVLNLAGAGSFNGNIKFNYVVFN